MPQKISLDEIIKNNPQIDPKQLEEGINLWKELGQAGLVRRRYSLVPPFSKKRVRIADNSYEDSRTIHLRRF